ncbi:MAG: peptide ABC transporter substrate-binding protein [Gammaproteobacteria bacterium]
MSVTSAHAKDQLVIGVTQFPATFNPNIEAMLAKTYTLSMTMRPLTAYDHQWKLICMLCTEVPSLENGGAVLETMPDGKQGIAVTYTLQPKATWGDGTPITTQDVLFTWQVGREPKAGIGNQEMYRRILKIDARDDKTFTLHEDRVTFEYAAINDFLLLPAHLEKPVFEANPSEYRMRSKYETETTNPGLYFGPYKITGVSRGAAITLEPNPTWWGTAPFFKKITVKTIENTAALEANLLSGEIDAIAGELGLTLDQALAFERRNGDHFKILYQTGLFYEHLDAQLLNPILSDVRVRQALMFGIDRAAISRQLFADKQPVANSLVNPLDWAYDAAVRKYDYDPKHAAELLDAAGWKTTAQGIRQNAQGERLSIELMTTAGNRSRELLQQVMQNQWKQLGIEVKINNQPARVFFGETMHQRKFQGLALFSWVSSPENVPRSALHSTEIPTAENGWSGQNYTSYNNANIDALLDALEVELDRNKRKTMWAELQAIYANDLPSLPLFFRADSHILPKWLEGVRPTGHQNLSTLWVEEWRANPP